MEGIAGKGSGGHPVSGPSPVGGRLVTVTPHRTVALVGPAGSGKTALAAALTGGPPRLSGPLSWSTVTHAGTVLHLLDAPGDPFLAGPLLAGLHAADLVLVVLSAGADARTVQLWEQCEGRPRVVAVTGLDRPGSDFDETVALCRRLLGEQIHPLSLPLHGDGPDEAVQGVLDLLTQRLHDFSTGQRVERDPDPQHLPLVDSLRSELVEAVLSQSAVEALLDAYLDDDVVPDDLVELLHGAVAGGAVQPVLPVSPHAGVGLIELLDVLTASTRHEPPVVTAADGSPTEPISPAPDGPYVAQVLQVTQAGALVRVLSGTGPEQGAVPGEVCVVVPSPGQRPGDTLGGAGVVVQGWRVPEPQHPTGLAGPPATELVRRVETDLTARLSDDGQHVLWTLGPTHAAQLLDGLAVTTQPLQVVGDARAVLRVLVPDVYVRTVVSDLSGRQGTLVPPPGQGDAGHALGTDDEDGQVLTFTLPDRELLTYAVVLAALTHGTGSFAPVVPEAVPPGNASTPTPGRPPRAGSPIPAGRQTGGAVPQT